MERINIGNSNLTSSRIGLGTWAIGGWMWGGTHEAESIATIRAAIERGVTLIDTAPAYGFGRAEEIVGKALAEGGLRDKVLIATKVGLAWHNRAVYRDSRAARIHQEVEESLGRLRTDVIDLYQVHWPDLETPLEETARALEDLRRHGKIRAIGVSNYSPGQMNHFRAFARLDAVQPPYNLFEREIEGGVLPYAARTGLTVLSYGALCRGLLSGRMRPDLARERYGKSVLALAVRWVLDQGRTIALWGARRPEQLDAIGEIDGWRLDPDTKHEIDAILRRCITNPVSPAFMAPPAKRPVEQAAVILY
ncbi:MAG: aldo/keto reductase [Chloroflexi bacterium]|nr:MAG: aldo/keto reductase [Chloroflexota bacterium]